MNAVIFTVEGLASRAFLHCPPRGTPSRLLARRLHRPSHPTRRCLSQHPSASNVSTPPHIDSVFRGARLMDEASQQGAPAENLSLGIFSQEEVQALRRIYLQEAPQPSLPTEELDIVREDVRDSPETTAVEPYARRFFNAIETSDARELFSWLYAARQEGEEMVANLPTTTFSEFLRCLDPVAVGRELDPTHGISITAGVTQFTMLGQYVNRFGIRVVWLYLLRRLVTIYELRVEAGHRLLPSDYRVLLRYAGAASDILEAKRFWHDMEAAGYKSLRQTDTYNEYIKARFLTEELYGQYDMPRFRVRPLNLHKQKFLIPHRTLSKLDRLRMRMERKLVRFGQNIHQPDYADHITRILRKTQPVRKVFSMVKLLGFANDEKLLRSVIIAWGRNASINQIETILADYWKIRVDRDKDSPTREVTGISGGAYFERDSPLRPSVLLLDAIVQAYCCNAEMATALKLVDYIARRYNITIPEKLWFDLLSWTYIMVAKPAAWEWRVLGTFPSKVVQPGAVELVFAVMTSEPYNIKPGFAQYSIIIKRRIAERKYSDALQMMREMKEVYKAQLREHEHAMLEFSHATTQKVSSPTTVQRYRRAKVTKWHMWYDFEVWCWTLLKQYKPTTVDDDFGVHTIPNLVDEFRAFMPDVIKYRLPTGDVQLTERTKHRKAMTDNREVSMPAIRPAEWHKSRHMRTPTGQLVLEYDGGQRPFIRSPTSETRGLRRPRRVLEPSLRNLDRSASKFWLLREFT